MVLRIEIVNIDRPCSRACPPAPRKNRRGDPERAYERYFQERNRGGYANMSVVPHSTDPQSGEQVLDYGEIRRSLLQISTPP